MADPGDFACPECEAQPEQSCAYVDNWDNQRLGRVGKPTARPHNSRMQALWEYERWSQRLAELEYLRCWLQEFGDIFDYSD